MPPPIARRLGDGLWLIVSLAILGVAAYIAFTDLGHYLDGYDEGVYLASARLMDRGYPLYRSIFDSQAPLWLFLVDAGYRVAGESARSGRLATAAGFPLTVAALVLAGRELQGRLVGLLAGAVALLSPFYLRFARIAEADVPSAALAALAVALAARYANHGRRRWLVLAALAVTASILTKLNGLFVFPALAVLILARWANKVPGWRRRARYTAVDLAIVLGIAVGVSGAISLALGPSDVWKQAVAYHLAARAANHSPWLLDHARAVVDYLRLEPLIVPGLPLVALTIFGRWRGLAVLTWLIVVAAGLADQEPLQDHQIPAIIPPLALAIAFGWGQLWTGALALGRRVWLRGRIGWIEGITLLFLLGLAVLAVGRLGRHVPAAWAALRTIDAHGEEDAINLRVTPLVLAHSAPGDFVLTDQQSVASWLNRDVPPGLADTSFVRIDTGFLTADQVIDESNRFRVKLVILESGRLTKFPAVVAWVERNFPNHADVGDARVVYWR